MFDTGIDGRQTAARAGGRELRAPRERPRLELASLDAVLERRLVARIARVAAHAGAVAFHGGQVLRELEALEQPLFLAMDEVDRLFPCAFSSEVFRRVGGWDEGFVLAFNDVDLCLSVLKAGYRVVWTPDAELYHLESKTRGYEDTAEKQARFRREYDLFHLKWGEFLRAGDPYYSPHFRLDRPDFALKAA